MDSSFSQNSASEAGGAFYLQYDSNVDCVDVEVKNSEFASNSANHGGAVYANRVETLEIYEGTDKQNISIMMNAVNMTNNVANSTGGGLYFSDDWADDGVPCKYISTHSATILNAHIIGNEANISGGGIYSNCVEINVKNSVFDGNVISFDGDITSSNCVERDCLLEHAKEVDDFYGGAGAGFFAYSSSVSVTNCQFMNNRINMGNGAAFASKVDKANKYIFGQNIKLILSNNTVTNNDLRSHESKIFDVEVDCKDYIGLIGFGAGFWIELSRQYNADYVSLSNNTFEENRGVFINDLYYNLYDIESQQVMEKLYYLDASNSYGTTAFSPKSFNATSYGTSPTGILMLTLALTVT